MIITVLLLAQVQCTEALCVVCLSWLSAYNKHDTNMKIKFP